MTSSICHNIVYLVRLVHFIWIKSEDIWARFRKGGASAYEELSGWLVQSQADLCTAAKVWFCACRYAKISAWFGKSSLVLGGQTAMLFYFLELLIIDDTFFTSWMRQLPMLEFDVLTMEAVLWIICCVVAPIYSMMRKRHEGDYTEAICASDPRV